MRYLRNVEICSKVVRLIGHIEYYLLRRIVVYQPSHPSSKVGDPMFWSAGVGDIPDSNSGSPTAMNEPTTCV